MSETLIRCPLDSLVSRSRSRIKFFVFIFSFPELDSSLYQHNQIFKALFLWNVFRLPATERRLRINFSGNTSFVQQFYGCCMNVQYTEYTKNLNKSIEDFTLSMHKQFTSIKEKDDSENNNAICDKIVLLNEFPEQHKRNHQQYRIMKFSTTHFMWKFHYYSYFCFLYFC